MRSAVKTVLAAVVVARARLRAAAARRRKGGRKPVITPDKVVRARGLIERGLTVREAAGRLIVGKTALYEALRGEKANGSAKAAE